MIPSPPPTNFAHLLDGRARRRVAVAGFSVFVTAAISVPLVFSPSAGASASPHHHSTPATVCSTTTTLGATTTTTAATTTTADTTTTIPDTTTTEDTTTTTTTESIVGTVPGVSAVPGITTPITEQTLGQQGIVQLGATPGGNFVTLPVSAQAAAGQLPRTGSSSMPAVLGGLTLLVAGALATLAKRRRYLGMIPVNPKARP
jgi:LPXTG-motif cell wall-anchored protein